ncbi:MAG: hypothetical protein ABI310_00665, partial [Microbacteriaceae bacterium]
MSMNEPAVTAGEITVDHSGTTTINEPRWSVDPRVVLRVVPGEGVYALQGEATAVLRGAAYEALVPLIDGRATSNDLVDALTGQLPAAEVYFAIRGMRRRGYLVAAASDEELAARAWW